MVYLSLLVSLGIILLGAEVFTNSIEWLGKKLHLGAGAVGSILAAVGTALPETMVPVTAILFGNNEASTHIGIGAILGAPFMLSTLVMMITGLAAIIFKVNGSRRTCMLCNLRIVKRDLSFFMVLYALALGAAFLPTHTLKTVVAALLVFGYFSYALYTIKDGLYLDASKISPLFFAKKNPDPSLVLILLQIATALAAIIAGANVFVGAITDLSVLWGIPAFILAIIIAPIATELPEKFNSIIWIRQRKDTLALGNITGAMVFQSSLIPALGIILTSWELSPLALTSGILALFSTAIIYLSICKNNELKPRTLIVVGSLYFIFFALVLLTRGNF